MMPESIYNFMLLIWHMIYSILENIGIATIKEGPIPSHVAFVMDGNRRWATRNHLEREEGHLYGYKKLEDTLNWCEKLGIRVVTVYAFSIDNFKRSKKEVDSLMELADKKFREMLKQPSIIDRYRVAVRILGRLDLLPHFVRKSAQKVMDYSQKYSEDGLVLNMCMAYSATDEIIQSIKRQIILGKREISVETMNKTMHTFELSNPDPDLIVRTSGEIRLSDFLTWQCSGNSMLFFTNTMWPEFSIWNFLYILLKYQIWMPFLNQNRQKLLSIDQRTTFDLSETF